MARCPSSELLRALLADRLSGPEAQAVEAHVETCASCQEALEQLTRADGPRTKGSPSRDDSGGDFLRQLEREPPTGAWLSPEADISTVLVPQPPPQPTLGERGEVEDGTPGQTFRCPHCHNPIRLSDDRSDEVLCPACGGSFRVRDAQETITTATTRLGKFQLLERVGVGAFGAVWRARDVELDRLVALKIPHVGLLTEGEERERLRREARAAAQLRHPGLVTVHEVVELNGLPAIVADFVSGVTLKDYLEVHRLTFREAAALVAQLAEALEYAHARGLVHRDVKPGNVMLEYGPPLAPLGRGAWASPC
jgi:hypothetical protein